MDMVMEKDELANPFDGRDDNLGDTPVGEEDAVEVEN
jgi:hypothetical protein